MCTMHVQMYQKDLFEKEIGIMSHEQKNGAFRTSFFTSIRNIAIV